MGKQSQLLFKPTEVELGLQVGVEFDNIQIRFDDTCQVSQQSELKPKHELLTQTQPRLGVT